MGRRSIRNKATHKLKDIIVFKETLTHPLYLVTIGICFGYEVF